MSLKSILFKPFRFLWSLFLNGLITLLPLTLTIVIFHLTIKIVSGWLEPLQDLKPEFLKSIPYSEILLVLIAIFFVGVILRILVLRSIVHSTESIIAKIPLVRPVYTGIRQLVQAFGVQDKRSFKKVVLIEFPKEGIFSLGFLTSELSKQLSPNKEIKHFTIFVPTTPNPTSGYFIIIPEKKIQVVDLSHQEAMALIISGGIIQPDRFKDPV